MCNDVKIYEDAIGNKPEGYLGLQRIICYKLI